MFSVKSIQVIDIRTDKTIQTIVVDGYPEVGEPEELLEVVDANFDGLPDISVPFMGGGAGPNNSINFYLFDQSKKRFVYQKKLSSLTQVSFNKNRTISSAYRNGCCDHIDETWRFNGRQLTVISRKRERDSQK